MRREKFFAGVFGVQTIGRLKSRSWGSAAPNKSMPALDAAAMRLARGIAAFAILSCTMVQAQEGAPGTRSDKNLDDLLGSQPAAAATPAPTQAAPAPAAAPAPDATAAAPAAAEPSPAEAATALDAETTATAASAPEQTKATPRKTNAMVEEIVVTAQKREENLSQVPISIQAFTPAALAARGIDNQLGLSRAVPSLDVGTQAGYATIFLRGIGTEAFLTADPSIASYVDGVYFPFSPTFVQDFSGVQRVEVLKGPQGTLFGRNAVGGAISVTTLSPSFTDRYTDVELTAGNFGLIKPRVYANFPITNSLAFNFSSYYSQSDLSSLSSESRTAGLPLRKEYNEGVRIKGRWDPIDDLDITFQWTRTRKQGNGAIGQNIHPSPLAELLGIRPPTDLRDVQVDTRLYGIAETRLLGGQAAYTAPWLDIKILGSTQHDSLLYNYDFDGSSEPLVSFDVPGHPADIKQGELQLISNKSMPFSEWLDVTGGAFFFRDVQGFNPVDVTVGDIQLAQLPAPFDLLTAPTIAGITLGQGRAYKVQCQAQVRTISDGYYLQTTARFTDWVALTLGARAQREYRGLWHSTVDLIAGTTDLGQVINNGPLITYTTAHDQNGNPVPGEAVTHGVEPKVTLDFHPFLDDTLLFASYQIAKKAHAYNAFAIYETPQYIKPEKTTAFEIGLRTPLLNGTTHFNIATFYYRIQDLQTQYVSLLTGGALAFQNAPLATSKGVDFDLVSEILPSMVDGLAVSLNGAFLDAKFGSYPNAAGYQLGTELFATNNNYSGNRQTRSPRASGTLAITKLWTVDAHYHNSGFYYSASNDPNYQQKGYGLLGAFVRYKYVPWDLDFRVYGKNLTNQFYTQGVISTDFGGVFTVAAQREVGGTVTWKFGR